MKISNINILGQDTTFHHIGMAVQNITKYTAKNNIITDKPNGVKVAFIMVNGLNVELIEPLNQDSPVPSLHDEEKIIYHLAFASKNISASLEKAKKNGFIQIHGVRPAKAFGNKDIVWLHHKLYGLIEIIEIK